MIHEANKVGDIGGFVFTRYKLHRTDVLKEVRKEKDQEREKAVAKCRKIVEKRKIEESSTSETKGIVKRRISTFCEIST